MRRRSPSPASSRRSSSCRSLSRARSDKTPVKTVDTPRMQPNLKVRKSRQVSSNRVVTIVERFNKHFRRLRKKTRPIVGLTKYIGLNPDHCFTVCNLIMYLHMYFTMYSCFINFVQEKEIEEQDKAKALRLTKELMKMIQIQKSSKNQAWIDSVSLTFKFGLVILVYYASCM
jgi:hypothetical protein